MISMIMLRGQAVAQALAGRCLAACHTCLVGAAGPVRLRGAHGWQALPLLSCINLQRQQQQRRPQQRQQQSEVQASRQHP